jgi:hypothetical protein
MKKSIFLLTLSLFLCQFALAQTGGINFQGLARNASGEVLINQKITLRFSVLLSSETGATEYQESKEATTNAQGMFSLVIGEGSILNKTGNFSDINWKVSPKFLKVEMDPSAGSNFTLMGTSKLQAVPFAYYANGVDAENVQGVLPAAKGGTGVASISALKGALQLDQVSNTSDANKPLSTATQTALATKVDKVEGKTLSTNDFSTAEKTKLAAISGTNTGDQDLSGLATTTALATKANAADVTTSLATKVDKVEGKALSSNDFSTAEKTKLAAITGTNTGDQDLSGLATTTALATKANAAEVTTALATKVDKVEGKDLSTNDYSTAEKTKLAAISGTNTGDQDLSGLATTTALATKANAAEVTTALATKVDKVEGKDLSTNDYSTAEKTKLAAITGTNTGDQDLSGLATTTALATKANAAEVTTALATKVDKVEGKTLSTNDFSTAEKTKLAAITGTNTGDQDLSGFATTTDLATKANAAEVTTALATKVDKVEGKELSSNDYSTAEKTKLAAITGTNTGDQDLSGYATTAALNVKANSSEVTTALATKANAADVTTALATKVDKVEGKTLSSNDYSTAEKTKLAAITGTNTGDQDLSGYATTAALETKASSTSVTAGLELKENVGNKSTAADLGGASPSDLFYPTQKAVKAYVAANAAAGSIADGGITTIKLADGAVTDAKVANGISKSKVGLSNVDNTADAAKPISTATQTALDTKANAATVTSDLATKVDKVAGKGLSTNDYSTAEKTKLAAIMGTNTGDQDLSGYATTAGLATKADANDVATSLATKVDKVAGKGLSTNDYSTDEKAKLAAITGTNTGDQDLTGYATITALDTKASTASVTSALELKENVGNKSILTDLGGTSTSDVFYPTQKAVKTYVDAQVGAVDKVKVGLGNVDNTADALKPISTATQEALDTKLSTGDFDFSLRNLAKLNVSNDFTSEENIFRGNQTVIGDLTLPSGVINLSLGTQILSGTDSPTTIQNRPDADFSIKTSAVEFEGIEFGDADPREHELKFTADGKLRFSDGSRIYPYLSDQEEELKNVFSIRSKTGGYIELKTTSEEEDYYWTFKDDGKITFPDRGTTMGVTNSPGFSIFELNSPNAISLFVRDPYLENSTFGGINILQRIDQPFAIELITPGAESNNLNVWIYDSEGRLTFPDGTTLGRNVQNEDFSFFEINSYSGIALQSSQTFEDETTINAAIGIFPEGNQGTIFMMTRDLESDEEENIWQFDSQGVLSFPGGTIMGQFVLNEEPQIFNINSYNGISLAGGNEQPNGDNSDNKSVNLLISSPEEDEQGKLQIITRRYESDIIENKWTYDSEGMLTFPDGTTLGTIYSGSSTYFELTSGDNDGFKITTTDDPANPKTWEFDLDGEFIFPDGTVASGNVSGEGDFGFDTRATENGFTILTGNLDDPDSQNNEESANKFVFGNDGSLTFPDGTYFGDVNGGAFGFDTRATANGFIIRTGDENNPPKIFNFDNDGNLNLPAGGDIKIDGVSVKSNFYSKEYNIWGDFNNNVNTTPGLDYLFYPGENIWNWAQQKLIITLDHNPKSENHVQVYIDGQRISKSYFTVNENLLTIDIIQLKGSFTQSSYRINIDYQQ